MSDEIGTRNGNEETQKREVEEDGTDTRLEEAKKKAKKSKTKPWRRQNTSVN